jgi:hypothetical protein
MIRRLVEFEKRPQRLLVAETVLLLDAEGRLWHPLLKRSQSARWRCSFLTCCPDCFAFSTYLLNAAGLSLL